MQRAVRFAGVYVTHDQLEAMQLADRMAVMDNGSILQLDTPIEIYRNPISRYVACFVGQANDLEATVQTTNFDPSELVLDTSFGPLVTTGGRLSGVAAKSKVRVILRPEDIKLITGEAPSGHNVWRGTIQTVMFSGAHVEYRVRIGEQQLHVRSDARELLREGDMVSVAVDPALVYLFPDGGA